MAKRTKKTTTTTETTSPAPEPAPVADTIAAVPGPTADLLASLPAGFMLIGVLSISFSRGTKRNRADDLGLEFEASKETTTGAEVRGLGSHWTSKEAKEMVTRCLREQSHIRDQAKRRFACGPFPGTLLLADQDDGSKFLSEMREELFDRGERVNAAGKTVPTKTKVGERPRSDLWGELGMGVSMSVDVIASVVQTPQRLTDWAARIDAQVAKVPTGSGEETSAQSIAILRALLACPIVSEETRATGLALLADAELGSVKRVDFKRRLADLRVTVEQPTLGQVTPRRARIEAAPIAMGEGEPRAEIAPRRRRRPAPLAS